MSIEALGHIMIFDLGPPKGDPERKSWEKKHGDAAAELQCFPAHGREPQGAPGRVSEAEYDAMSQAQRWDYARSFPQSQFKR
jgi:hypothetical protein